MLDQRSEIVFAILYGSAIENEQFADLDIALFLDRTAALPEQDLAYSFTLADALETVLPYPIDIRILNEAPLPFCYNVSKGIPVVGQNSPRLWYFLERTWDDWFDFEPIAFQYIRELV
jgi:predicted nucleotidyltransferase